MSMYLYRMARATRLPPPEKALLIALCDRFNDSTGLCCPSYEQLSVDTGYERSTVSRNLKKLRDRGFVTWKLARRSGQFGFNIYTIDRVALSHAADNHVANNDNTELHSLTLPSSTVQRKPLHNLNKTLIKVAAKNPGTEIKVAHALGPPKTPEQFMALPKKERQKYAKLCEKVMRDLFKQGLVYSPIDDQ